MLSSDNFQYVSNRRYLCSIAFARLDVTPRHERLRNRNWEKVLSTLQSIWIYFVKVNLGRGKGSLNWIPARLQLQSLITIANRAVKFSNSLLQFTSRFIYIRYVQKNRTCSVLQIIDRIQINL